MNVQASRHLLEARLVARAANRRSTPIIPRLDRTQPLPLSFGEQRLWFADQVEPDAAAYTLTSLLRLTGALDVAALERALHALVRRHESLRTTYVSADGTPRRVIQSELCVPFAEVHLIERTPEARELALRTLIRVERRASFDLASGPLLRATLVRLGPEEHVLIAAMHHIVTDAWSLGIFQRELAALYEELVGGRPAALPELGAQYADFAGWQAAHLSGEAMQTHLAAWLRRLDGAPTLLELPTDHPRPRARTSRGDLFESRAAPALGDALRSLGEQHGATPFMVLLTGFQALLARLSGQADFLVGAPVTARPHRELEGLIGFFVNTLVLRADVSGDPTFLELLQRVREVCLDAYAHQEVPFERLVAELRPERDAGRNPLVQVMFTLEPAVAERIELPRLTVEPLAERADGGLAKFDLTVFVSLTESGLELAVEYSADLWEAATIERMVGHYCTLLEGIVAEPGCPLSTLPLLTEAQRTQQLVAWNDTHTAFPSDRCVHELVAEQALRRPTAIAVEGVGGQDRLTYSELEQRANGLAHRLRQLGVGRGERVAVCLERSPLLVVCLLAVLKAGGAYVPLDPAQPHDRLRRMIDDARPRAVIVERGASAAAEPDADGAVVCLESAPSTLPARTDSPLVDGAHGDDAAYVMYTSGSTGTPKGVVVPHRAITRLVVNTDYIRLLASDSVAQASNASFDAATFEIWGALTHGARLVVVPTGLLLSPPALTETIRQERLTVLFLTTALFNELARTSPHVFSSLRCLLFGGEASNADAARQVLAAGPPRHLVHVYGPTETTTFATWYPVEHVEVGATTLPIGRPIANTRAYVLDARAQPVPIGVAGELYIGGPGVALGYLHRPESTREKFVADPFTAEPTRRRYRTGDLVRYRADGTLEFLGRTDDQLKLRGFRIEPGEIEARLVEHPSVRQALVIVQQSASGDKQLVAYAAVADPSQHVEAELRGFLRDRLPAYMVPTGVVLVESLPLTPNGKVDRRALPPPRSALAEGENGRRTAARDDVERQLAATWRELLGHAAFGVDDNFFDVGGHSLLAARLVARIEQAFGRRLPLSRFLGSVTVAELAALIREDEPPRAWACLVPIQTAGDRPPLFAIHGAFGDVLCFADLAHELGPRQPVYGLQAVGLDGIQAPLTRTEDMAGRYIAEIRSVQPHGPYHLLGYSSGGSIAFEMAQQLELSGEHVGLLAIVDHPPHVAGYDRPGWSIRWGMRASANVWRNIPYWLRLLAGPGRRDALAIVRRYAQRLVRTRRLFDPSDDAGASRAFHERAAAILGATSQEWPAFRWRVTEAQHQAVRAYVPRPFSGQLVVLRARRQPLLASHATDLGWGALALGGVTVKTIPGGHHALLNRPSVSVLAREVSACLAAVHQPG